VSVLLSCSNLGKSYGGRVLFEGLTLSIHDGERVGMIGPNGAGKSTLLKILAGLDEADEGERALSKGGRLAFLAQEDVFPDGATVEQVILDALVEDSAWDEVERSTRASVILGKTGFLDPAQPVASLSGGWRKRLALARALVLEPDLLLLDEPTNHLDLRGIEWLEKLLVSSGCASLIVTHDRYFLERVTNRVVEVGRHYPGGFLRVEGSYSTFLLKREELLAAQAKAERSLANTVRREVEWLRRGPQGRRTKAKDRIKSAHDLMGELDEVRARNQAAGASAAEIDFSATGRRSRDLLVGEGLALTRGGRPLFRGLDLRLGPGERLGLVGDNGCGKSSLLAVLGGELEQDAGSIKRAHGLRAVVFHQNRALLDPEATLRETLCAEGDTITYNGSKIHVTSWAKRFRFDKEQLATRVGALSGGEQARLLIADLVRQPADLLLLDEPTNDLDLPTREVLEESLLDFPGALILVTHDRYMLERVCTGLLGFDGQGGARPLADLDQWRRMREAAEREEREQERRAREREAPKAATPHVEVAASRRKMNNKERREWAGMEDTIMTAEAEVESLQEQVEDPQIQADHEALQQAYTRLHAAQQRVESLYARWSELESLTP
jgi:ABC transport system ATP-binding/permease protein